jgi:glycosyltransferase involved in cell wall biosynthesis
MKVLLVGVSAEPEFIAEVNAASRPGAIFTVAATRFTQLVLEGFRRHMGEDCESVLLVPIGMYPESTVRWWSARRVGDRYYLPFVNFLLLKQLTIAAVLGWRVLRWAAASRGEKRVVVFTCIYLPFLAPFAALAGPLRLKIAAIVPDVPEYEFNYTVSASRLKKALIPAYIRLTRLLYAPIDYFVFLTEAMKEKFPTRPYEVMEGLIDANSPAPASTPADGVRSVMYSGSLLERFGVRTLIDAFRALPGDYELWLFGVGDMTAAAQAAAEADPRIRVFGLVPNQEVLSRQRRATVLIDPRPASSEFTRYSFPSKILEYMSSGRPVLTTRLPGIPADYGDKLWFIDDESVDGMRAALARALGASEAERTAFGARSAEYARTEKNNVKRVGRLIAALEAL